MSEQDLKNRLYGSIQTLWDSILKYGYQTQEELTSLILHDKKLEIFGATYHTKLQPHHNIKIAINENDELLFLDGRHRLCICLLQKISAIPVRIVFYHPHSIYASTLNK